MSRREDRGNRGNREDGLTAEGFAALLVQLDPAPDLAAEKYETVRRKLIRLFEWRGCTAPEDLADETINRVARRLAEGVELRSNDPYGYFCGVAHLVYKEVLRRVAREHRAIESQGWLPASFAAEDEPADSRLESLRRCLDGLPPDQHDLILRYYRGEDRPGESNIRNRQSLARDLELPMNALRIRVHRVRRKLESCVQTSLRR
jgi:DNA-directed RNA polymerase specialized sigma24 family protein